MTIIRSVLLFVVAAFAEVCGAWLIWQGVREHKGLLWIGAGIVAASARWPCWSPLRSSR